MENSNFKYFVVFAEMRTGSNFLEQNINQFEDLECLGELFNPRFIGFPNLPDRHGITKEARDKDPNILLDKVQSDSTTKLPGFRFFNDHDSRVLKECLEDPACGKIILTRNALDSYVSRKIAAATGQWKLTDLKDKKTAKITFNAREFEDFLDAAQSFQLKLLKALQITGQTAFYINYDDINSIDVLNGLAKFLGSKKAAKGMKKTLKKQNPAPMEEKVKNFAEMQDHIKNIDFLNLSQTPNFEPRRGAGVPGFIAGKKTPILFLPIKGGPVEQVVSWLKAHEGADELVENFNQKTLRQWRRGHGTHETIAVVRHPVARAHHVFCEYIISAQQGDYRDVREALAGRYKLRLPKGGAEDSAYSLDQHKSTFLDFLTFLKGNLAGQTEIRIDPAWASQTAILQGAGHVAMPGHIVRELSLAGSLAHVESLLGLTPIACESATDQRPYKLADIYDMEIEKAVRDSYMRDYINFGFEAWAPING